ncbi:MAG: MoxR family ATPase [Planctomycetota bacterium]|nr:MoxR family ATPase [Planctomycetota bacterium]MDA1248319.1 MoxR family ATPase [Planctomycetota bacterium]
MSHPLVEKLIANIEQAVIGKPEAVRLTVLALLAEGHLLIEDVPGVGKTSLAKALARSLNCKFTRLQFTPDMLPSDILGSSVFLPNVGEFEFRAGPIFSHIVLADEINRTTPRTQSALLEAMSESQVSIEGKTRVLERPFFVLATQNPFEFEGTFPLPENQLDRFMLCIDIGYPDPSVEKEILTTHRRGQPVDKLQPVLEVSQLESLQQATRDIRVDDSISEYLLKIVTATRDHSQLTMGVSTRGALTFYRAVQARALIENRDYATPDDVKQLAIPVLAHRVVCQGVVREGHRDKARTVIRQILDNTRVPA